MVHAILVECFGFVFFVLRFILSSSEMYFVFKKVKDDY